MFTVFTPLVVILGAFIGLVCFGWFGALLGLLVPDNVDPGPASCGGVILAAIVGVLLVFFLYGVEASRIYQ